MSLEPEPAQLSMVERVAAALHDSNRCGDEPTYADDLAEADNFYARTRVEKYRRSARAAIAAMREPTEGMTGAAADLDTYPLGSSTPSSCAEDEVKWRAMIDAALAEDTGE